MSDSFKFFAIALLLCLAAAGFTRPEINGDWPEYTTTAIAIASHGTPDIRIADVHAAQAAFPSVAHVYEYIGARLDSPDGVPELGLRRARDGRIFAWHFFAYPALVAVPFAAFKGFGVSVGHAFMVANWGFVLVLALSLRRLLGSGWSAGLGVLLFLLTGGLGYCQWPSPEWTGAAALLSALALFLSNAPILAGLLAGFASSQNPSIASFIGFAPLLRLAVNWEAGTPWALQVRRQWNWRYTAGLAVAAACAAAPYLFNEWAWGVPSLIASTSIDWELATRQRFLSYLFDLNQGLIIGFPAIVVGMLAAIRTRRDLWLAISAILFTLTLVLPTLATRNWNSGAAGVMRYAFWSSMPITFVLLLLIVPKVRSKRGLVALVIAGQAVAAYGATRYNHVELSPLAKLVLSNVPRAYDPDIEIFVERIDHAELPQQREPPLDPHRVIVFKSGGVPRKVLAHEQHGRVDVEVCGAGGRLSTYTVSTAAFGWRYFNGPFGC